MSRSVRDTQLETRTARAKLTPRGKPYFRSIGPGIHLGYRKGSDARRWVARTYVGGGEYLVKTIGDADDLMDADGDTILSFAQAQDRARNLVTKVPSGPYTLGQAIDDYAASNEGRAGTARRLSAQVPAHMKAKPVAELTKTEIIAWHRGLAKMPPRVRPKAGLAQAYREADLNDPEIIRRRKVNANSLLWKLNAVLNLALEEDKVASGKEWLGVKKFENVTKARTRYLSVAEAKRLINACDPDFRKLVQAGLITGCRYQEIARLTVADFNPDSRTLLIPVSKSGKPRHVVLSQEGVAFFQGLVVGRRGDEFMLGRRWSPCAQARPMKAACMKAKIFPPISFHVLRHTWASLAAMGGMPLMVIARNLGHADTKMVEKHYGHLSADYVSDQVRAHAPTFGITTSNVKAIR